MKLKGPTTLRELREPGQPTVSAEPGSLALDQPPNPVHCPLCGQPNRCAMEVEKATGQKQPPCWCTAVNFEPSLLARIPAASRGLACICRACAARSAP